MIIGVPKEIKDREYRVSLTTGGAERLVHAVRRDSALCRGVNACAGRVTSEPVARTFGMEYSPVEELI